MLDPGRDDPVTGRRMLTESAYADDRNLRARMAIWAYATGPADPSWRLQPVAWDGTQRVADVGCGNGFDLRQLLARGWCGQVIGLDLSPACSPPWPTAWSRAGSGCSTRTRNGCR